MNRNPVRSSNLAGVGFDAARRVLEVQFRESGDVWQYAGISPDAFRELVEAPSIGSHFAKFVRGAHRARKCPKAIEVCPAHLEGDSGCLQWCDLRAGHSGPHDSGGVFRWNDGKRGTARVEAEE